MSRRGVSKPAAGIQLFPFLAVLICTMGSLVVLLFAFARHGQMQAAAAAQAESSSEDSSEADADLAGLEWRVSQLQESRTKTESQLAQARLQLSHVEDHLRRLREECRRLKSAAQEMERLGTSTAEERAAAATELEVLKNKIRRTQQALDRAQRDARERPTAYSVVPYTGPNQTRRRPIYIECTADSIILQPEGIPIIESDFEGPLGPSNPLAAAMRAQREYLMSQQGAHAETVEPYPLLIVRPDGIMAYYAARAALVSWGSEFGYELIGQDWKLAYPPGDPQLAELTQRTIGEARVHQRQLVLSAPRSYTRDKVSFRPSPTRGGFVEDRSRGGRGAGGKGGGPGGGANDSPFRFGSTDRTGGGNGTGSDGLAAGGSGVSGGAAGSAAKSSASGGAGGASSLGESSEAQAKNPGQGERSSKSVESIAKKRGRDWGLPDASQAAVPITRPVYLDCRPERLIILPEQGSGGGKEIPLAARTQDSVEDLVSAVWQHMKTWGIAGRGLYWKPTLLMDVAPGAEARYAELETLLADSGLEVKRRQKNVAAAPQSQRR